MIQIQTLNSSANLKYFKEYLISNYDFKNIVIGFDCLCLEFETEPNQTEETAIVNYYNAITESDWLDSYKLSKIDEINFKTEELIQLGYYYSGKVFSLSTNAQTNILALYTSRNDSQIIYPIEYNTLNDLESFMIQDSSDIESLYLTALGTKKAHLDSGTILKNLVRNAINQEEVNSIIDNR